MKIYTKRGDGGTSTLSEAGRIPKNDPRFALLGDLDELNAHIGLAKAMAEHQTSVDIAFWETIQTCIIRLSSHVYDTHNTSYFLTAQDIAALEEKIDGHMGASMPGSRLGQFVLPGRSVLSAQLDVCRTVARRCERRLTTVNQTHPLDGYAQMYVNRLSDYFFAVAQVV